MARKKRVEIEGGLYHVITRGNDRQDIFHSKEDHTKFLSLIAQQKARSPFFLYAYCLMTNHLHLLIERQEDTVGRIMQRVLTGYSQYYNRKYGRIGHVFQGRYKAILCDSDSYLAALVRYIHLNPVRARMVVLPEEYPYSSHRAYLGIEPEGVVDVDPVLRLFGARREIARRGFAEYVRSGIGQVHPEDLDSLAEAAVIDSEEFVDGEIHRVGLVVGSKSGRKTKQATFNAEAMLAAVEAVFGVERDKFCGPVKAAKAVMAKEVLFLTARDAAASVTELSEITGIDTSTVSRRTDAARLRSLSDTKMAYAIGLVKQKYADTIRESQA